jgi:hypothetical protein
MHAEHAIVRFYLDDPRTGLLGDHRMFFFSNVFRIHFMSNQNTEVMDHHVHWRLVIGIAVFHLALLAAVHLIPRWILGETVFSYLWWSYTIGSLAHAQYALMVIFWAISPWKWSKRTAVLIAGMVVLTLMRVPVMFFSYNRYDSPMEMLWDLLLNQIGAFIGIALVLAVCLELLRPFWGVLSREPVEHAEHLTISNLLRLTTIAAIASLVLSIDGGDLADPIRFSIYLFRQAVLAMSCIWMMFAPRYAWIGVVGCLAAIVGEVLATPTAVTTMYGHWHWLPSICLKIFWICSTLLVVRSFGYRLRKYSRQGTDLLSESLSTENAQPRLEQAVLRSAPPTWQLF